MGSAGEQARTKRTALRVGGICLLVLWQAVLGHLLAPPNGCMLGDSYEYLHLASNLVCTGRYAYDPAVLTLDNALDYQAWIGKHRQRGLLRWETDPTLAVPATDVGGLRPTAMRQPLYPAFLGTVLAITGHRPLLLFLIQAALVCAAIALAACVSHVSFARTVYAPLTTVLLLSGFLPLILTSNLIMPEVLSITILLLGYLMFAKAKGPLGALLAGICLAIAGLTKAVAIPFGAWLITVAALSDRERLRRVWWMMLIGLFLPLGFWATRNYLALGRPTISTGEAGVNLWYGAIDQEVNPLAASSKEVDLEAVARIAAPDYYITVPASDRFVEAAMQEVQARPAYALAVAASRVLRVGFLDFPGGRSLMAVRLPGLFRVAQVVWVVMWICHGYAAARLTMSKDLARAMWSVPCLVAVVAFLSPLNRTLMPFQVLMLTGASATMAHVVGYIRHRWRSR